MSVKTSIIALSTMAAIGIATPAAVGLYYQYEVRPLQAHTDLSPDIEIPIPVPVEEEITAVDIDEVVLVLPAQQLRASPEALKEAELKCSWHQSHTLANSKVKVCDIERTQTGRSDQLLEPKDIPRQLIEIKRDAPSPSGMFEGS
jgi:hypothetical protein